MQVYANNLCLVIIYIIQIVADTNPCILTPRVFKLQPLLAPGSPQTQHAAISKLLSSSELHN